MSSIMGHNGTGWERKGTSNTANTGNASDGYTVDLGAFGHVVFDAVGVYHDAHTKRECKAFNQGLFAAGWDGHVHFNAREHGRTGAWLEIDRHIVDESGTKVWARFTRTS